MEVQVLRASACRESTIFCTLAYERGLITPCRGYVSFTCIGFITALIGMCMLMRSHIARGSTCNLHQHVCGLRSHLSVGTIRSGHRRVHVLELASQEFDLFRESAIECREITHFCGYRRRCVQGSVPIRASAYECGELTHHMRYDFLPTSACVCVSFRSRVRSLVAGSTLCSWFSDDRSRRI